MTKQILVGLHIRYVNGQAVLNTDHPYFWQITPKTKGKPKVGNLALVNTAKSRKHVVILAIEVRAKSTLYDGLTKQVIKFEDRQSHHETVNLAFEKYLAEELATDET